MLLVVPSFLLPVVGTWSLRFAVASLSFGHAAEGLAYICYYFAFSPPRWLLGRWQRAEHGTYLARTAEREPEERARLAPDDLLLGIDRAIGAPAIVAIRSGVTSPDLVVRAATDPGLVAARLTPGDGLMGRAWRTCSPALGAPAESEPALVAAFGPHRVSILVAPIIADTQLWGLVVVAHRRGALFPEDDLAMLAQLGRSAATALDHAQLIVDRREHAKRAADRRLREVEARVAMMFDSIQDYAMLVLDAEGRVTTWQPGAQHVFGYTSAQITGRSGADLYEMNQADFSQWLADARRQGHAEREGTCRRLDGSTFLGTTIVRPLVDEPGESPAFVAVTHDVTERRELEERMRQGQKMEAIGQLAGGIAHDFNNLLTAILGYADWLERDLAGDPRAAQVWEIQKAGERAADLTRQLLAFSRRQRLQHASLDLSRLVTDLLPMLRRLIGGDIEIVDLTASPTSPVMGDRSQLEQVVLNLVVNARDAMPDGGRISIRSGDVWLGGLPESTDLPPGPYVLLEVTDTGIGMDAETRRRVFDPFFTTKEFGQGTGLGLSTVYGIVQQMGGVVQVTSEPGRGASFCLYFPASQPAVVPQAAPLPAEARGSHETLLLVEDDASLRSHLKDLLESHGYRVLAADHPRTALTLTESFGEPIDLIISDVLMPGGAGPEFVQLLGRKRPGLSALYLFGQTDGAFARQAALSRVEHLLEVPFSSTDLLTKIRQILSAA